MPLDIDAITAWLKGFAELTFPIAVAAYLLFKSDKTIEGLRLKMNTQTIEMKVGFAIIINKLDAQEEYENELELALARDAKSHNPGGIDG